MDKPLKDKELQTIRLIRNALMQGKSLSVRELQAALDYRSPRSAAEILEKLGERGIVQRRSDGRLQLLRDPEEQRFHARTVDVPLVGEVPCGHPLLADENIEAMIPVSIALAQATSRHFLLRARGHSMNERGIEDGDIVLARQQSTADNGDVVVALIDDAAVIKEFHKTNNAVILRPRSRDKSLRPIVVTEDFQVQGVVVAVLPGTMSS